MRCLLGLDIGTTSTIGILITVDGRVLAMATRPATLSAPHPGWAEEDPEEWWANVCALVPDLLAQAGIGADAIAGIGVAGMLPATILLDDAGRLLRPSIQQSDGRTGAEVAEIAAEMPEADFVARTGNGINQQLVGSRIRWIARHEPDVHARIATVVGSYDFINLKLTGARGVERNWALEAGFLDIATQDIADDLVALAHLPRDAVPPVRSSADVIGAVTPEAATATGLAVGTPVAGGAADHIASAFVAGVIDPGDVLLKFGGAADILIASETARPDPRMFLDFHLVPGRFMPNGCMATGGSGLNWFVDTFAGGIAAEAAARGQSVHAHLDALAAEVGPGAGGVLVVPYLLGEKTPVHDPDARGIVTGLGLNHGLGHLWAALLEGYGYAFRHHVDVFNDMGFETRRFLASDGGAQSDVWMQACADILGAPIARLEGHPGSCLGAAWAAAIATGAATDWAGVQQFVSAGQRFSPRAEHAALHRARYAAFRASYAAIAGIRAGRRAHLADGA